MLCNACLCLSRDLEDSEPPKMATTAATPKPEMTSNHKQDMHSVQGEPSLEERIGMKPIPTTTVRHAAPVVQERVHDLYTHVDKTQVMILLCFYTKVHVLMC